MDNVLKVFWSQLNLCNETNEKRGKYTLFLRFVIGVWQNANS